jgi:hypothetical protein
MMSVELPFKSEKPYCPDPPHTAGATSSDPRADISEQLRRLLASSYFRHSERYTNFLRFVVHCTLEEHHEMLKERMIGIEVLGKSPDFDTGNDTSVRVVANEVRKRLALYYDKPEHKSEILIRIPVRSYVAEFQFPSPALDEPVSVASAAEPLPDQPAAAREAARCRRLPLQLLIGGLLLLCVLLAGGAYFREYSAMDALWEPLLKDSKDILFCVSPYHTPGEANLPSSAPVNSGKEALTYKTYRDTYNGVALFDVIAFSKFSAFLQLKGKTTPLRSAQNTSLTDLQGLPVILLGGFQNNWTMRFEAGRRFRLSHDQENRIRWIDDAQAPGQRQWRVDDFAPFERIDKDYLLVTREFHQPTEQWWMTFSGLTGIGTMVGSHAFTDPKIVNELFRGLPPGWRHKNFQMVLEFKVIQGSPGSLHRVAFYTW